MDAVVGACCSWALTPLERQLGYAAKVGERVEDLGKAMKHLKARSEDITARIKEEQRMDPTKLPTNQVEEWLQSVHEIENEVNSIKASYEQIRCRCLGGCSANICSNWKIGRKATYELLRVDDLSKRGEAFNDIVTRAGPPPPGQKLAGTSNLVAIEPNLKKVLDCLHVHTAVAADKSVTIGLYGMGGVGKTTLLRAINNELRSGSVNGMRFDHVIWVVVSNHAKIENVQADIAKHLNLSNEASAIFNFLNDKKFIILLDDIWERLDLDDLGIPDHRVVLFTTRFEKVCGEMEAVKKIKVECLQKEEAWRLFVDKVGEEIINASPEIKKLAKEVAEECKGLPLALTVLGRAMSSKHTPEEWRHTLTSLKKSQPHTSDNIQGPVLNILKCSYDGLPDETTRKCFLFCALYPEDYSFNVDKLIKCFWGHGLIDVEGCSNYGEIYDLVYDKVVGVLMSACLLEAHEIWGKRKRRVKMHDVIRDMALWIARDCGGNNAKWVVCAGLKSEQVLKGVAHWEMAEILSFQQNDISCLPMLKGRCEKLSTLILQSNYHLQRIPKGYFESIPALTCLDLSHTFIEELPEEVSSLIQLQYLNLSYTRIQSLSISLSNLKKLKHLGLRKCRRLHYIPYGLISCLPVLQFLDMYMCQSFTFSSENFIEDQKNKDGSPCIEDYTHCESKGGTQKYVSDEVVPGKAHLKELKILKERHQIKSISLDMNKGTIADCLNLVNATSVCELRLEALEDSNPQEFIVHLMKLSNSIEGLDLLSFGGLGELILTRDQVRHERGLNDENLCFSRLSHLALYNLQGLHKITWTKLMLVEMFPRLRRVVIESCHGLQNLTWAGHLPYIHELYVKDCKGLEEIISSDEDGDSPSGQPSSIFPNLCGLALCFIENLHNISKTIIDAPKLSRLTVYGCPKLKRLPFSFQQQIIEKRRLFLQFQGTWWDGLEWEDTTVKCYLDKQI